MSGRDRIPETAGGSHFRLEQKAARALDGSRLLNFHYPMTIPDHEFALDVRSIHYSNILMNLNEKRDNVSVGCLEGLDTPVIHDEYVHVPCQLSLYFMGKCI